MSTVGRETKYGSYSNRTGIGYSSKDCESDEFGREIELHGCKVNRCVDCRGLCKLLSGISDFPSFILYSSPPRGPGARTNHLTRWYLPLHEHQNVCVF